MAEWESESGIMGQIYEESLFTIAASSAADSSQGLFDIRETINFVRIPYDNPEGTDDSPVYAFLEPPIFHIDQDPTPLSNRAWVMQESVLSRRTVHFTMHGLVWSCSSFSLRETDDRSTSRLDVADWHQLLRRYSTKDLTYKSDKLHTIQGLANEYSRRHSKRYYYGVFIEDIGTSLCWFGANTDGAIHHKLLRDVGSGIPSWSWASVTGPIEFLQVHVCQEMEFICHDFHALGSGLLRLDAPVKEIGGILGPFPLPVHPGFYIEDLRKTDLEQETISYLEESSAEKDDPLPNVVGDRHILQDASSERIGWCVFDDHEAPMEKLFFLAIHQQKIRDWWMPPKESVDDKFVFGLILRRSESKDTFERVGFGHIMDTAWIMEQGHRSLTLM